jgi:hypothetical protein
MKRTVLTVSLLAVLLFGGGISSVMISNVSAAGIISEAADVKLVVMGKQTV